MTRHIILTEWVWHDVISIEGDDEKKQGIETKENARGSVFWDSRPAKLRLPEDLHVPPTQENPKSGDGHNHVHQHLLEIA